MATISPTQLPNLARNTGVAVVADTYRPDSLYFPRFTRAVSAADLSHYPFGHRQTKLVSGAVPEEREPGQSIAATTAGEGYTLRGRIRFFDAKIVIPDEHLEAYDADRNVVRLITETGRTFSANAGIHKDTAVANLFNRGALTAGDTAVFDGGFPNDADPNRGFIYDGLPFFDTAHTIKFGSTTYANHIASAALGTTTLDAARLAMSVTNAVNDAGKRIIITPDTLIVPPDLERTAWELTESQNIVNSGNNNANFYQKRFEVIAHPLLTDTDGWFLGQRGGGVGMGIAVFDSGEPVVETWRTPDNKATHVSFGYRFGVWVEDWRYAHANNVAAA